jgi:serine/threonine-protein kinase HipA
MSSSVEVRLWGKTIGYLALEDKEPYATFQYDDEFIKSQIEISPIMMPLSNRIYKFEELDLETFKGLPGLIADSLPDDYGTHILESMPHLKNLNPIEQLQLIGKRGMGALEFYPNKTTKKQEQEIIRLDEIMDTATKLLNKRHSNIIDDPKDVQTLISFGTSAGGARPKGIVAYNARLNRFKSGQIDAGNGYTYWIIKLDVEELDYSKPNNGQFTRIEYAYYLMAKDAGIQMSESRLYQQGSHLHFMSKRFDRIESENPTFRKLHMQTLCGLTHQSYKRIGIMGYEDAVGYMVRLKLPMSNIYQFFRRMVFNVMTRNQDDHTKNTSFLMDTSGQWCLSPAYDISYAYKENSYWLKQHQMSINQKLTDITLDDVLMAAKRMNIQPRKATQIISEVREATKQFLSFASKATLDERIAKDIFKNFNFLE